MAEQTGITSIFEDTFDSLYSYVYRRVDDKEFIEDILKTIYLRIWDLKQIDDEQILLIAYQFAYSLLKERELISTEEDFWSQLNAEEAEVLRLRYLEGLSTFEIAFVLQEQAGKLDAFLYATLMKVQEFFPSFSKEKYVGAYFGDLNAHFAKLKEEESIQIPQEMKLNLASSLFTQTYNADRDFHLPETEAVETESSVVESEAFVKAIPNEELATSSISQIGVEAEELVSPVRERGEVNDFFNKPMDDQEKEQFTSPADASEQITEDDLLEAVNEVEERHPEWVLKEEENWVPEDKGTDLPEDNPEGYGMDLLKTFSKKEEELRVSSEEAEFSQLMHQDGPVSNVHESEEKPKDPFALGLENTDQIQLEPQATFEKPTAFPDPLSVVEDTKERENAMTQEPIEQSENGVNAMRELEGVEKLHVANADIARENVRTVLAEEPRFDVSSPKPVELHIDDFEYDIPEEVPSIANLGSAKFEDEEEVYSGFKKSVLSPLIALVIVVLGTVFWPFSSDSTPNIGGDYEIIYGDEIGFNERKDLADNVLKDLLVDRKIEDVRVERLTAKNVQITLRLEDELKDGELFVFYKMDDGRWAPRKYQAILKND